MRGVNTKEQERRFYQSLVSAALLLVPWFLYDAVAHHRFRSPTSENVEFYTISGIAILFALPNATRFWQRIGAGFLVAYACLAFASLHRNNASLGFAALFLALAGVVTLALDWWVARSEWKAIAPNEAMLAQLVAARDLEGDSLDPYTPANGARKLFQMALRQQSAQEGRPLTDLELLFCDYSRLPSSDAARLVELTFFQAHDCAIFKERIAQMICDVVRLDRQKDPDAWKKYRQALRDLKKGGRDQQLALFLEHGILRARTDGEMLRDYLLYVVIAIGVVPILLGLVVFLGH